MAFLRGPLIVNIYFDIQGDTVRIQVPEARIDERVSAYLGYSHRDDEVIAVGFSQEQVAEIEPERVGDPDQKIEFINPFKGDQFHRKLAEYFLHHYVVSSYEQIRRSWLSYWLPGTFDEIRIHLRFPGYELIPRYVQNYFARKMKRFPRLGELTVNNRVILGYE